jgi:hypothetical protein
LLESTENVLQAEFRRVRQDCRQRTLAGVPIIKLTGVLDECVPKIRLMQWGNKNENSLVVPISVLVLDRSAPRSFLRMAAGLEFSAYAANRVGFEPLQTICEHADSKWFW